MEKLKGDTVVLDITPVGWSEGTKVEGIAAVIATVIHEKAVEVITCTSRRLEVHVQIPAEEESPGMIERLREKYCRAAERAFWAPEKVS